MADGLEVVSILLGWIYFFAWSLSFWPQTIDNYRRKSVVGFSCDYLILNMTGFTCYAIYNIVGYIDPSAGAGNVVINDVAFAVHAWVLTAVQVVQLVMYEKGTQKVHTATWVISACLWTLILLHVILAGAGVDTTGWSPSLADFLVTNTLRLLGIVKVCVSFIKYLPQVYMNYIRQSTVGWSIANVLLDFTGGSFSFLQMFVDGARSGNWDIFGGDSLNVAKFCLSIESMLFDLIFIFQHYVLYRHSSTRKKESITVRPDDTYYLKMADVTDESPMNVSVATDTPKSE
eukprot:GILK01003605.1.p1 GENE.GILK01003605.1~~GILK01003605.1.p1  ORF type:complete len:322 (-),score=34.72 GILK01003605.1:227-1090(-)